MVNKSNKYKTFGDFYDVESPMGRKQFLAQNKEEKRIASEKAEVLKIKANAEALRQSQTAWGRTKTFAKDITTLKESQKMKPVPKFQVGRQLSQEQEILSGMFAGEATWGTGNNLPVMHGTLMPNSMGNEFEDGTAQSFGIARRNTGTGGFFGI